MSSAQMGSARFFPQQLHFSIITIVIFVVFLVFPTSNGSKDFHKECSSLASCGNITNIGYPFWGDHLRPQYCGHPAFELKCPPHTTYNQPILQIHGNHYSSSYAVVSIDNSTMTIMLQNFLTEFVDQCLTPSSHLTDAVSEDLIQYSAGIDNITLSYDCDPNKVEALDRVKDFMCPPDLDYGGGTTYFWNNDETKDKLNAICNQSIQVPVLGKDDLRLQNLTLRNVLEKGFDVNYTKMYLKECYPCVKSGGSCGFSMASGFMCFCKGWNSTADCKTRKSGGQTQDTSPDALKERKSGNRKLILKIVIPGASLSIITALTVVGLLCLRKCKSRAQTFLSKRTSYGHMGSDLEFRNRIPVFSHTELLEATDNFDPARELGDGGFGVVYQGKLRDGREVAIKRLFEKNHKRVEQFKNEVEILATLNHPNLVTLFGCTSHHSRELLLVYEYISNGTVADHLYGDRSQSRSLTWTIRMRIAIQTAGALSYLHAVDIIHRDVKTNNILLDNYFSVKVADFGLSRLYPLDATHVSTAPQGTPGYLDPQYYKCYQVTEKSDVYSFGVVLIELISSLPAIDTSRVGDEINLSIYAMNKIQHGKLCELVDEKLGFDSDFKVKRMITLVAELAFQCLQQEKEVRPSMEGVLEALKLIESVDYETLEEEEMSRGHGTSEPASAAVEDEAEQSL